MVVIFNSENQKIARKVHGFEIIKSARLAVLYNNLVQQLYIYCIYVCLRNLTTG